MKILTLAAATALLATPALAADAVVYNEPAPAVADTFSWTGGYIGVNAGYAGGKFKTDMHNDSDDSISLRSNSSGFIGGVQAGYNWQFGQTVVGIETDIQGSGVKSDFTVNSMGERVINLGTKISWFGTTRARLGYTPVDRFMVYATGGVAYGKVKTYVNSPFDEGSSSLSDTRVGYTVGAGAEYALTNNVTLKSEYLYTDLGKLKFKASDGLDGYISGAAKSQFHTLRVGLNYKF